MDWTGVNMRGLAVFLAIIVVTPVFASAEQNWPGEPVDNHVHMSWAAMSKEVNDWADANPEICLLYTSPSPRDTA